MSPLNFVPFRIKSGDMKSQNFPISEAYNEKPGRDSWYRKCLTFLLIIIFLYYGHIRWYLEKDERFGW